MFDIRTLVHDAKTVEMLDFQGFPEDTRSLYIACKYNKWFKIKLFVNTIGLIGLYRTVYKPI